VSSKNLHIIEKQFVEIKLPEGVDGNKWLEKISTFCHQHLHTTLEKLFDRYGNTKELIQIDKLAIDLGKLNNNMPDDELAISIANRLEEQLYSLIALKNNYLNGEQVQITRRPVQEEIFNQWLYYLEYGILPLQAWHLSEDKLRQKILTSLASNSIAVEKLQSLLSGKPTSVDRLALQQSDHFLQLMLETCTAKKQEFLIQLLEDLEKLEKRWAEKTPRVAREKRGQASIPKSRVRFWKEIITRYMTGKIKVIKSEQLGDLVLKIFPAGDYEDIRKFIKRDLANNNRFYPVLGKAKAEILKEISKIIVKDRKSISALGGSKATDKTSKDRRNKKDTDTQATPVSENIAVKPEAGETKQRQESGDKVFEIKDQEKYSKDLDKKDDGSLPLKISGENDFSKTTVSSDVAAKSEKKPEFDEEEKSFLNDESLSDFVKEDEYFQDDTSFTSLIKEGEGIYIHNAGLVLLHPFFTNFFRKLKLLHNNDFIDNTSRHHAVHLIQYMATGKTELPEYEMLLAKLICGLQAEDPIARFIALSEIEMNEVEVMLQAAIEHWGTLGKTSSDGLREGFLQRDGKLEKHPSGWHLMVEQKSMDILLDSLPNGWGLSTIKLPWMKDIMYVEWR